jgi:hypothetical protein
LADLVYSSLDGGAVGLCESIDEALDALKVLSRCGFVFFAHTIDQASVTQFSTRASTIESAKGAVFIQALPPNSAAEEGSFFLKGEPFALCASNHVN